LLLLLLLFLLLCVHGHVELKVLQLLLLPGTLSPQPHLHHVQAQRGLWMMYGETSCLSDSQAQRWLWVMCG
jgi:hypothetical protein